MKASAMLDMGFGMRGKKVLTKGRREVGGVEKNSRANQSEQKS